jgi:nucleoside phosphorylase
MRPSSRNDFTIAIICGLTLEADAVEALFDETYDRLSRVYKKQPGDDNAYINGKIGAHNVVLCYMPGIGNGSAAGVASSLKVSYTGIQIALVVGICGGVPYPSTEEQIFLGDVIISDAVVEYDFGRQCPGGFQRKTDVKDTLGRPNREIRALLAGLKASRARGEFQNKMIQYLHIIQQSETKWRRPNITDDILFNASYQHKHHGPVLSSGCLCFDGNSLDNVCREAQETICGSLGCDENQISRRRQLDNLTVHIGTIATADTVMKSGGHRDDLAKSERVIGFEMEGGGVWDTVPCIIIKGVCDYADSHKNKVWQPYAAATGASAAKSILEYWTSTTIEGE